MPDSEETVEASRRAVAAGQRIEPGVVVIVAAGRPAATAIRIGREGIEIGRRFPGDLENDDRVSRKHVLIRRQNETWHIEDLTSRNGTEVDGQPLAGSGTFSGSPLVRIGRSLLWAVDDIGPFLLGPPRKPSETDPVLGGRLWRAWTEIALAARSGDVLCLRGESGAGKELAARAFHDARCGSASPARFVAINCAAIPEGLAERLLFGARKGAYSGAAADTEGYVQAAHGGTLFLDEIAELNLSVQAKLLRVVENREVLPLGASSPRRVEFNICAASHDCLRDEVRAGRFREDLYFRLGRPEVRLPPLRERIDEMPRLVARELGTVGSGLVASVGLIEACALRPWPGNVRELLREMGRAAHRALAEGSSVVEADHLAADAGMRLAGESADGPAAAHRAGGSDGAAPDALKSQGPTDAQIAKALAENGGNVAATARVLGMHRNQLRRRLDKCPDLASRATGTTETTE